MSNKMMEYEFKVTRTITGYGTTLEEAKYSALTEGITAVDDEDLEVESMEEAEDE